MTFRLYYDDSFVSEFSATVLRCHALPAEKGSARFQVTLEQTAFYPTSGGQPHDTGTLGDAKVMDVVESDAGEILHITDAPLPAGPIRGAIDWPRRWDHMQQHTGQHLLSAAFVELFGAQTVSFHLGRETSSIDVALPELTASQGSDAERLTNSIIFDNRAVKAVYGTEAQLHAMGIRKAVNAEIARRAGPGGVLRAIEIENFDRQPCGGTHVARTGQVGVLLLRKVEKQKQNMRVEFVCGERAARAARADFHTLGEAARLLSCAPAELAEIVAKQSGECNQSRRELQDLQHRLAVLQAGELLEQEGAPPGGAPRWIARRLEGENSAAYLRMLATALAAHAGVVSLLVAESGAFACAKHSAVPGDLGAAVRRALQAVGGKGGGARDFAQGSLESVSGWQEFAGRVRTVFDDASSLRARG